MPVDKSVSLNILADIKAYQKAIAGLPGVTDAAAAKAAMRLEAHMVKAQFAAGKAAQDAATKSVGAWDLVRKALGGIGFGDVAEKADKLGFAFGGLGAAAAAGIGVASFAAVAFGRSIVDTILNVDALEKELSELGASAGTSAAAMDAIHSARSGFDELRIATIQAKLAIAGEFAPAVEEAVSVVARLIEQVSVGTQAIAAFAAENAALTTIADPMTMALRGIAGAYSSLTAESREAGRAEREHSIAYQQILEARGKARKAEEDEEEKNFNELLRRKTDAIDEHEREVEASRRDAARRAMAEAEANAKRMAAIEAQVIDEALAAYKAAKAEEREAEAIATETSNQFARARLQGMQRVLAEQAAAQSDYEASLVEGWRDTMATLSSEANRVFGEVVGALGTLSDGMQATWEDAAARAQSIVQDSASAIAAIDAELAERRGETEVKLTRAQLRQERKRLAAKREAARDERAIARASALDAFALGKALAVTVATIQAAQNAVALVLPLAYLGPGAVPAAAALAGAGLAAQLAVIAAQKPPKFHTGGTVDHGVRPEVAGGPDDVPAILRPGEVVTPPGGRASEPDERVTNYYIGDRLAERITERAIRSGGKTRWRRELGYRDMPGLVRVY